MSKKTSNNNNKTQQRPESKDGLGLWFKLSSILLAFALAFFIYFVFIPQLAMLNALEENECKYVSHESHNVDPVHCSTNSQHCFNYVINVEYEHAHKPHHFEQASKQVGEKHKHHGKITSPTNFDSRENIDQFMQSLKEQGPFTCYVNTMKDGEQVLLEKPPTKDLLYTAIIFSIFGALCIYLLKIYVTSDKKKHNSNANKKKN